MKEGKHEKSKFRVVERYSVLLLIATLLMSIGYAEMSGITLSVAANVKATVQEGVFITEVTRTAYDGADITNSKINSYAETTMNSTVVLGNSCDSTISYNVWLYNNSDKDHVFIGITKDEELYKNTNITYSTDLVPYGTVIEAGKNKDFTITFSYAGNDTSNTTLNSILNFRFLEVPKLEVSSAGDISGIYPGQAKEATFTVTNFDSEGINGVPLDYTLETIIYDANGVEAAVPIMATICNTSGTAVTGAVSMTGDGTTKTTHTYTLKLAWDERKNSADYAGRTYSYKIKAVATPKATETEGKYNQYTLTKEAPAEEPLTKITTAPFYFITDPTSADTPIIEMADNKATINLTVSNNDGTNYNPFETKYTIALDNTDFTLYVAGVEYANNITGEIQLGAGALINSVEAIELKPKVTSTTLTSEEVCNITITTTSPYVTTETIKITATDKTGPTAPEITGGSEGTYATSQTISVSKEATDVGTGVKYYQYIVDSDGQEIATTETGNVGSTTSEISHTFDTDYAGYYVYFRAVDAVGNPGAWSNAERLFIDTQPPTIEPKEETVEITENDNNSLETYFNISENGNAEITKKEFIDTCHNNTIITDTNQLAVGTHTIQATVEKETGATATAMLTIIVAALGFTLTFIANGSVFHTINEAKTISFPEEDPTLTGKAFTGWYYDEATTQIATEGDSVTQATNLYAGWKSYVTNKNNGETTVELDLSYSLQTIYVYESDSVISNIEIDASRTTATVYGNCGYDLYDWGIEGALESLNVEGNEIKVDASLWPTHTTSGKGIFSDAYGVSGGNIYLEGLVGVNIYFEDGSVDSDIIDFYCHHGWSCLAEGTQITLADRSTKAIEDIRYDDSLLVWDFDRGEFASAKPLWIKKLEIAYQYNLLKFENGAELKTIDQHRIFNKELGKFSYPMTDDTPIGTTTFTDNGTETKLISKEIVNESVAYYNVITDYHMNLFANGILTSCRFSNLYNIKNMKYVKDNRKLIPKEEYPNVPDKYYHGLRLAEQPKEANRGNDVHHANSIEEHIQNVYIANEK